MNEDREEKGKDGSVRKAHYGDGEQPWDTVVLEGWAPHFAAANVLKYLRRTKDPKHSLESARWYHERLIEMFSATPENMWEHKHLVAWVTYRRLKDVLSDEENNRLRG